MKVIPSGEIIGIKMYSKGVLVIGKSRVEGMDGNEYEPYNSTNIQEGDTITHINGKKIETIEEMQKHINASNGKSIDITYLREQNEKSEKIIPIKANENSYKIGFWVRDGALGIGTLSFYDAQNSYYGALGHPVSDVDIKQKIDIESGKITKAKILSITKGQKSRPGEIRGFINSENNMGDILSNTSFGIYGKIIEKYNSKSDAQSIEVASRHEIIEGDGIIRCTVDENGPKEYKVRIEKINNTSEDTTKSMIIKVVDEELLSKTGGIVQGMSGSPIIQKGKFIGAVTHVFINDPTRGYAIFADTMVKQLRDIGLS